MKNEPRFLFPINRWIHKKIAEFKWKFDKRAARFLFNAKKTLMDEILDAYDAFVSRNFLNDWSCLPHYEDDKGIKLLEFDSSIFYTTHVPFTMHVTITFLHGKLISVTMSMILPEETSQISFSLYGCYNSEDTLPLNVAKYADAIELRLEKLPSSSRKDILKVFKAKRGQVK